MKYTKKELRCQLQMAYNIKKSLPTQEWWIKNASIQKFASYSTVCRHFGSWNMALKETFNKINLDMNPSVEIKCDNCPVLFLRQPSQIKKSSNNFCSLSCTASYCNRHKTHGSSRSKLEVWLEDQLNILYTDLEIHFNRKDAIGSELDIYFPSLKLAIELNGIFHYEPIFGKEKLERIQENDQNKFQACQSHGISLCIIDISGQKYFKPKTSQKYLDIIVNIIEN